MSPALLWSIAGFALLIVEFLSGTFYLLVLGVAAFGAAVTAWAGFGFEAQALAAAAVALAGAYVVHAYRARNRSKQMVSIDAGQPASFESWVDQGSGLARVRYRGASWDARLEAGDAPQPGAMLYVLATEGNTLRVTSRRPA
jgi:membrane protein implicated in regulation of membrane protease activity